jgi:hypothetical protein
MSEKKEPSGNKTQVIIAIIGLIGVLGTAIFANFKDIRSTFDNNPINKNDDKKGESGINVDFSGKSSGNQFIVSDNIEKVENNTTNILQEAPKLTTAPTDVMSNLLPGTPLNKVTSIFGKPNRRDGGILLYNKLDNLYIRLVVNDSNEICSATFQLRDNSSIFTMYPIDVFFLGKTSFHDIFKDIEASSLEKEADWFPKGGNYSSITEFFGASGQYFTYTFGISEHFEGEDLEQLPHSNKKIDFVTVTGDECPLALKSGLRWYEYL